MPLSYDFDIHWILPQETLADPEIAKMMGDIGFDTNARSNYVALFRDPKTVEALRGADDKVRSWLESSGFGFNVYDSGAGPGAYPAADEAARIDVIDRLSKTMKAAGLKEANFNGFHLPTFLKAVVEAKPVKAQASPPKSSAKSAPKPAAEPAAAPSLKLETTAAAAPAAPQGTASIDIDAAFANPKSGSALPRHDKISMDDLMNGPAVYGQDTVIPGDDLKYRPSLPQSTSKGGVPMMPFILVGAVFFFFLLFVVLGDSAATTLVAR